MQFKEQDTIFTNWKIKNVIGEGSFGIVYEIEREEFGHTYKAAAKVISIPNNRSEYMDVLDEGMSEENVSQYYFSMVEDIINECVLLEKMKGDSHIVSYEDHQVISEENGISWKICIRMELLKPLATHLRENKIKETDVVQLGIDICRGLETCEKFNIIHRDIKPENIFVSSTMNYKLGDFGISRTMELSEMAVSKKGTQMYMAPEVYKGEQYDATVDLYSLGLVLYRLMNNNRSPFLPPFPQPIRRTDKDDAIRRRISGEPIPAPVYASKPFAEVIKMACQYDPKERYHSPKDMRRALESVLDVLEKEKKQNTLRPEPIEDDGTLPIGRNKAFGKMELQEERRKREAERLKKEEEARQRAEEEERRRAEEEARQRAEEEERRRAEEARQRAEEEERRRAEEARQRAEEEERRRAEEARQRAEEEARKKFEEETRRNAEEEVRKRAEEEARKRAEEEARQRAEEEARKRAEEEARQKAEEEARKREEARRRAEKEERQRIEAEKRRKDAEARQKSAEEARRRAEEEERQRAEAKRKAEEARKKAEEEARKKLEEESRLQLNKKQVEDDNKEEKQGIKLVSSNRYYMDKTKLAVANSRSSNEEKNEPVIQNVNQSSEKKKLFLVVPAAIVALVILICFVAMTKVPDLRGTPLSDVETILSKAKLLPGSISYEFSADVPKDTIIAQQKSGKLVKKYSIIDLVVSKGLESANMPDITNKGLEEAQALLQSINVDTTVTVCDKYSISVGEGVVCAQSPQADELLSSGAEVIIYVSKGALIMPDVVGQTKEEALDFFAKCGITPTVQESYSKEIESGRITSQNVEKDAPIDETVEVVLEVSLGVQMITVPNVVNLTQDAAIDELVKAGFKKKKVKVVTEYNNSVAAGYVISQEIAEGTQVEMGGDITIHVSLGKKQTAPTGNNQNNNKEKPKKSGWEWDVID